MMITSFYYSSRFKKQQQSLLKSDKKGILAAQQAETIIAEMRDNGGTISQAVALKLTKHGERRAQKCKKYDLGGGYRLITLRDGTCLYIAFVGTHDECDLWFKQQRNVNFNKDADRIEMVPAQDHAVENDENESSLSSSQFDEDRYECELLSRIDGATLRHVFSGFYQQRK